MCWTCVAKLSDLQETRIAYGGHGFFKTKIKFSQNSKDASYEVSIHLPKQFHRRNFLEIDQPETRIVHVGFVC